MKIAGEIVVTSKSSENLLLPVALCPDLCVSHVKDDSDFYEDESVEEPCHKPPVNKVVLPPLLSDAEAEAEFDSFLLDAAHWL